jgi:hypothetical protein
METNIEHLIANLEVLQLRVKNTQEWRFKNFTKMGAVECCHLIKQIQGIINFLHEPRIGHKKYILAILGSLNEMVAKTTYWMVTKEVPTGTLVRDLEYLDKTLSYIREWEPERQKVLNLQIFDN